MNIYLLRHAIAEDRDPEKYPRDFDRPLTKDGRARMKLAAEGMKALGLTFDLVLSSPLIRALQTARIAARVFDPAPPVQIHGPMAPGGTTQQILSFPKRAARLDSVLLVGHEPDLSRLASNLLAPATVSVQIAFKKGALCRIDFEAKPAAGEGILVLLLTPKALRAMAG